MQKTPFIWLGSKRSRKYPIGAKGSLLDIAASRGLPTPNGGILLHEAYELLRQEGVITLQGAEVHVPDPDWLHETIYEGIRFPRLQEPVALRAAFATSNRPEDGTRGAFSTCLHVNALDAQQLAQALGAVWSSAGGCADEWRRDVLIMTMVREEMSGTAVTLTVAESDAVWLTHRPTGTTPDLCLPPLRGWQRPSPHLPPYARRLSQLLNGVRRSFGPGPHEISWIDDGRICWLIQIRPLLRATIPGHP